ncbi:hypothetical protein [Flavobacterium algicola]|uniref:hypothetical protein n=1 Tax=Flavobacterium algicola TaxID=556529 RepID=UPI001EFEAE65|nr:hypothetical protein [Flavobacterium algicola]MCG9792815.1 hypothetical protein [Flavobacterium algicola]
MSKLEQIYELPIYKKAELLFQLVESLVATLPEEDDFIEATKDFMLADALILPAKIVGAESGGLYSIKMQNAAIIRQHGMSLHIQVGSLCYHENYKDLEYVALIQKELEEFRKLFIPWVSNFDTANHVWDEWELFNPEGANPLSQIEDFKGIFDDFDDDFDDDFEDEDE